ncbi:MAG: AI-2E family transporter, partial [Deltaproteobacteria bacterium]|nr:AI-2E family transporter [Deltaproteobacteria bacterium]
IVRRVERRGAPRWASILLVYLVTVGGTVGFVVSVVPTLFDEMKSLARDLPTITQQLRNEVLPKVDARLRRFRRIELATQEGVAPPSAQPAPPPAPILVTPREDGAYEIRLQDDVEVKPSHDGGWLLSPRADRPKPFSSERVLRDALDRSVSHLQSHSTELLQFGRQLLGGVSRGIFYFFITLMLAGYMMMTWEDIRGFFRDLSPEPNRVSFDRFLVRLDRGLAGVVRGQLLICLVNGVLTAVGLWIFNLRYWPVLSLIAGMMSIIPIFGSILSSIPAVALGLTQGPGTALGVLLWIVGIHQLEANFLNPKIIGDQAKIHPVLVVFSLLLGESLFAITGALLAVPCLAAVQAVFLHFRESILGIPDPSMRSSDVGAPPGAPMATAGSEGAKGKATAAVSP